VSKFDWKNILGSVAPALATALGGPLAGMATKAIASSLIGDENASEADIASAIQSGNPDMLVRLKEADIAFETRMAELGVDLEKISAEDRSSARDMAKATTLIPQSILAAVFVIGFAAVLTAVFMGEVQLDGSTKEAGMILLGILSAGITQILNFFFGSSAGSKEKTSHLAKIKGGN